MNSHGAAPSSAPQNHFNITHGEFGYVQRRVRKTSVDERRVSLSDILDMPPLPTFSYPLGGCVLVVISSGIYLIVEADVPR